MMEERKLTGNVIFGDKEHEEMVPGPEQEKMVLGPYEESSHALIGQLTRALCRHPSAPALTSAVSPQFPATVLELRAYP